MPLRRHRITWKHALSCLQSDFAHCLSKDIIALSMSIFVPLLIIVHWLDILVIRLKTTSTMLEFYINCAIKKRWRMLSDGHGIHFLVIMFLCNELILIAKEAVKKCEFNELVLIYTPHLKSIFSSKWLVSLLEMKSLNEI